MNPWRCYWILAAMLTAGTVFAVFKHDTFATIFLASVLGAHLTFPPSR